MSHQESAAAGASGRMVDRMLFFSDAVFAIVLTLLVLELRPPESHSPQELLDGVLGMRRQFASFTISFALGAANWLVHMRNTRTLKHFDWPTAAANLFHLLAVALLPFAAAMLGEHINSPIAFNIYSIVIALTSTSAAVCWLIMTRDNGRLVGGIAARARYAAAIRTAALGIAFTVGLIFSAFDLVALARCSWMLLIPLMAIAQRMVGNGGEKGS